MEMTGGNPKENSILEIYAVKYSRGKKAEDFHQLIRPNRPIPPMLRRITGIHPHMVASSPPISKVMPPFIDFIGSDSVLVAHNVACDLKFLHHYAHEITGSVPQNFALCTHLLGEKFFPDSQKKSLQGLCQYLRLPQTKAHRAKNDALMTLALFEKIIEKLMASGRTHVEAALRYQGDYESLKRLGWQVDPRATKALSSSAGVYFLYDQNRDLLVWGAANNLAKHVAHLPNSSHISRSLYRKMMAACDVSAHNTETLLDAFLYVLQQGSRLPKKLKEPPAYHNHGARFLTVGHKNGQMIMAITAKPHVTDQLIYGPIFSKHKADQWLEGVADSLGCKVHQKKCVITEAAMAQISQLSRASVMWYRWLYTLSKSPHHKMMILKKWIDHQKLSQWHDLSCLWGLVVISKPGKVKVYPVIQSEIADPETFEGGLSQWQQSAAGKKKITSLKSKRRKQQRFHRYGCRERLQIALWIYSYQSTQSKIHGAEFIALGK